MTRPLCRLSALLLSALLLCPGLWSCSSVQAPETGKSITTVKGADYSIKKNEGQSYLVFDDITKYEKNGDDSSSGLKEAPNLKFPTVKKMKDTVLKGKLSEEQKAEVARFPKNEKNEVLVCDFDKLYEPSLPAGALIDSVVWKGERYTFTFHVGERFCGSLSLFNDEQYRKAFQAGYADHAVGNHVTVTETKEADGKTVSHYTSEDAESKRVRFQSKIGNTTVYIDKNYFIRSKYSFAETSSVIPNNITLYCTDGEKCYRIYLYELTEDPTDAVLLSLGLKEYREPAL